MNEKAYAAELRKKYIAHPPEGMTSDDSKTTSDDDLLDMEYFINEDVFSDIDDFEEGFYMV